MLYLALFGTVKEILKCREKKSLLDKVSSDSFK